MEQNIELSYLQRLTEAYAEHFHSYHGAPVFAVATEHFNPSERDADFTMLVERLSAFEGRRAFFNPQAEASLS
jgi:deoxyadenosine/deoxycytidine kinase